AVDDAELAALVQLGDEHVLGGLGAMAGPPLVVGLVLELEDGDAGLLTAPLGRRPGQPRRREDREQQGTTEGERRKALHDQTSFRETAPPIVPRRNALLPSTPSSPSSGQLLGVHHAERCHVYDIAHLEAALEDV